jgi:hypothetical protein
MDTRSIDSWSMSCCFACVTAAVWISLFRIIKLRSWLVGYRHSSHLKDWIIPLINTWIYSYLFPSIDNKYIFAVVSIGGKLIKCLSWLPETLRRNFVSRISIFLLKIQRVVRRAKRGTWWWRSSTNHIIGGFISSSLFILDENKINMAYPSPLSPRRLLFLIILDTVPIRWKLYSYRTPYSWKERLLFLECVRAHFKYLDC